jgi:hypothetical protein
MRVKDDLNLLLGCTTIYHLTQLIELRLIFQMLKAHKTLDTILFLEL